MIRVRAVHGQRTWSKSRGSKAKLEVLMYIHLPVEDYGPTTIYVCTVDVWIMVLEIKNTTTIHDAIIHKNYYTEQRKRTI